MNQTTRTISLVLISSALVFVGWGCPLAHEEQDPQQQPHGNNAAGAHTTHYRAGHSWFWYSSYPYGGYGGGQGVRPGSGGPSTGHPPGVSSRGGFGSTGGVGHGSGVS